MPFKSEKQRRWLWANEPDIAEKWSREYGSKPKARGKGPKGKSTRRRKKVSK